MISYVSYLFGFRLREGDRIRLYGGYNVEPKWLGGKKACFGRCLGFIAGQGKQPAALVELDEALTFDSTSGKYVVLELRYTGSRWGKRENVHIELCNFVPEDRAWKDRKRGEWIESHASYQVVIGRALHSS